MTREGDRAQTKGCTKNKKAKESRTLAHPVRRTRREGKCILRKVQVQISSSTTVTKEWKLKSADCIHHPRTAPPPPSDQKAGGARKGEGIRFYRLGRRRAPQDKGREEQGFGGITIGSGEEEAGGGRRGASDGGRRRRGTDLGEEVNQIIYGAGLWGVGIETNLRAVDDASVCEIPGKLRSEDILWMRRPPLLPSSDAAVRLLISRACQLRRCPRHGHGGRDGDQAALCLRDGMQWVATGFRLC
uniref:Uncharacterized protein n=1 Tax=Oryza brachyantha TaxID=4533 RepID=J3LC09_ORYBR